MDELLRALTLTASEIVVHYRETKGWMVTYIEDSTIHEIGPGEWDEVVNALRTSMYGV